MGWAQVAFYHTSEVNLLFPPPHPHWQKEKKSVWVFWKQGLKDVRLATCKIMHSHKTFLFLSATIIMCQHLAFDIFLGLLTFGHSLLGYHSKTCASLHDFEHLGLHFYVWNLVLCFLAKQFSHFWTIFTLGIPTFLFFLYLEIYSIKFLKPPNNVIKNIEFFFGFHGDLECQVS